ncbi:MAG: ABC transporter permease [Burkholderiales bacterium RIFCSPHIGHO2_12_FULL_61_11]|nr:MAG: ABC transporter permease [Burkholderiales bacterium RIFCSPHIGHO2_12_FULL_61_11]
MNSAVQPALDAPRGTQLSPEQRALVLRLAVLGLLGLALTLASQAFLTPGNLLNVLRQASLMFLLASGLTLVILCGGLDLSIGANVALSACLAGTVIQGTGSVLLGCAVGAGCGLAIGVLNGLMVTALRIPPFIATYGMLWILHGVTYWFMNGETIHGFPPAFRALGSGYFAGVPLPVYLMLAVLLVGTVLMQYTTWGQEVYATGANTEAAELSGVPVFARRLAVYAASGLMGGLASLVFLARLNSAEGDMGESLTLQAIAAVLIGGTSLFGGTGTLVGTLIGALILTVVLNGMNLLSVSANWQPLITGVIVILSVLSDAMARKRHGG